MTGPGGEREHPLVADLMGGMREDRGRGRPAPDDPRPDDPRPASPGPAGPRPVPPGPPPARPQPPRGREPRRGGTVARASGSMALGTLASRATGFLRTVALLAALGTTRVADAYNVANTVPNIVYDLLLGGVLSAVVVPLVVSAQREDPDEGAAFISTLITLTVAVLTFAAALGVLAAPLLMRVYLSSSVPAPERALAVTLTRFFLPQVLFYGVTGVVTAVLNTRGRFAAPSVAPVLNNLVVIVTAGVFLGLHGPHPLDDRLSGAQTLTLGLGTTLGVVVMAVALLPALRGLGLGTRLRLRDPRIARAARAGGWVIGYVVVNQLGYLAVIQFASGVPGSYSTYSYAYQLFQLPYAIVAVSVTSALLPRMSRSAAAGDVAQVRGDVSSGLRVAGLLLIPAALGLIALGEPVAAAAFRHGRSTPADARLIGETLAAFAVGLPAFSAFQLLIRALYALRDSRTPTVINVGVNAVNVGVDAAVVLGLPARDRAVGLALGLVASYLAGTALAWVAMRRRTGSLDGRRVSRALARVLLAGLAGALAARIIADALLGLLGGGAAAQGLAALVAAAVGGALFFVLAAVLSVDELADVLLLVPGGRRLAQLEARIRRLR